VYSLNEPEVCAEEELRRHCGYDGTLNRTAGPRPRPEQKFRSVKLIPEYSSDVGFRYFVFFVSIDLTIC